MHTRARGTRDARAMAGEAAGGGLAFEFQDRNQVHRCVKRVMASVHPEATVAMWDGKVNAAVLREPNRIVVFFRGTKELEEAIAMAAVIKKNLDTAGFTSSSEAIALVRDTMEVRIMVSELGIFDM